MDSGDKELLESVDKIANKLADWLDNEKIKPAFGITAFLDIICNMAASKEGGELLIEKTVTNLRSLYSVKRAEVEMLKENEKQV